MFELIQKFKEWCTQKVALHFSNRRSPFFKHGEVWWCQLGINVGHELYGKGPYFRRPVLIYKKFTSDTLFVLPITSQNKNGSWYANFVFRDKRQTAILNQARMIDARRLLDRIGSLSETEFALIRKQFITFFSF